MNKKLWIEAILYSLAIIFALISYQQPEAHAKTTCDAKCKKEYLVQLGFTKPLASQIVDSCKKYSRNPVHCIKYASSVAWAESSGGWNCHQYGCFGILGGNIKYNSLTHGVNDWVKRYNRWWYKATSTSDFYPPKGKKSKFNYCTSEHSSNTKVGCPNGLRSSSDFFILISKKF